MIRKVINIDEEKCNGCGLCVSACHEGAIELINGKARLVSDEYCDGLGDCLPECPTGAIKIVERDTVPYSEEAVKERINKNAQVKHDKIPCGCPGTMARTINDGKEKIENSKQGETRCELKSELNQWPIQINLINPGAAYLNDANLLIAADCTAYAYANFHKDFIKEHITLIGCPKLDDNEYYATKLTEIIKNNDIKSITVVRMEVPCCTGIVTSVKRAMLNAERIVPYREVTIGIDGNIV